MRLWLFDIDGTLLHAGGSGRVAFDAVMLAHHGVADGCRGLSFGGKTDPALIGEVYRARLERDPTAAEIDAFLERYLRELATAMTDVQVIDGVVDALQWLTARGDGELLGIATGNVRAGADAKLAAAGLAAWFAPGIGGYGSDSHLRAELVGAAIARATASAANAASAGHSIDEVIVVGDTIRDIAAARANGAIAIGVATGGQPAEALAAAGADVVMASLRELPAWLQARVG